MGRTLLYEAHMPKAGLVADHLDASLKPAPAQHTERRRSEQAITHWKKTFDQLGDIPSIETLGFANIETPDWSHRFLILADQSDPESSAILLCGNEFTRLMDLPREKSSKVTFLKHLPKNYLDVFKLGLIEAHHRREPFRREGEIEHEDGTHELYRVSFIPVIVKESANTKLVFGAFNRVVTD